MKIRVSSVGQSSNPLPILALIFTFGYWWPKRTFLFWAKLSIHTCFDCIQIITAVVISSPQLNCSLKPLPPFSLTLLKIIIVIRIEAACVGNVANSVIELTQADSVHFFMIVNCTLAGVVVGWFCANVELNSCTFWCLWALSIFFCVLLQTLWTHILHHFVLVCTLSTVDTLWSPWSVCTILFQRSHIYVYSISILFCAFVCTQSSYTLNSGVTPGVCL